MVGTFKEELGTGAERRALGLKARLTTGIMKELGLYPGVQGSHGEHLSKRGFISF